MGLFDFFKGNSSEENKGVNSEEAQALIARWDTFLQKIEVRYNEAAQQAEEALLEQLVETNYDWNIVVRSWQAMKGKIMKIPKKIDHVWETQVKDEMEALGDFHYDEGFKGHDVNEKLIGEIDLIATGIIGKLSEKFYAHAIQSAQQNFECTQCHAPLEIKKDLFRSQYVACQYCNTTNTFEPDVKLMQIGWTIVDNMAAYRALDLHHILHEVECKIQKKRPPIPDEFIAEYREAYINYYEKFYKERIALKSDEEERYETDMENIKIDMEGNISRMTASN